jgi:hypothetical protein
MSESNFFVNLKALSQPAVKLIEAVRDAVGIVSAPTRVRGKAKSKARTDVVPILARSRTDVRKIEARASDRLITREMRRQENIEDITKMAVDALPSSVSKDLVDQDWISRFFENCQDIRNEEMQLLWAKLLAMEVAKPGTFSLRTLRVIRDLAKDDALLFTRFCRFVWVIPGFGLTPIIHDLEDNCFAEAGLSFTSLLHLESLGLIEFNELTAFTLRQVSAVPALYYGRRHTLSVAEGKKDLEIGRALMTSVGKEFAPVAGSTAVETYRTSVVAKWKSDGWTVVEG